MRSMQDVTRDFVLNNPETADSDFVACQKDYRRQRLLLEAIGLVVERMENAEQAAKKMEEKLLKEAEKFTLGELK